jgi:hypothetical protein
MELGKMTLNINIRMKNSTLSIMAFDIMTLDIRMKNSTLSIMYGIRHNAIYYTHDKLDTQHNGIIHNDT